MLLRDLLVFGVVILSLPMTFRRPFIGLLVFSWLAYMRPQDLCWGFARSMRFSFFVGLTMVIGWVASESGKRPFWRADIRTRLMIALLVLMTISLAMAELHDRMVMRYFIEFIKIMVVALFTTGQVDSKQRLRLLLWTIALCLGFYGLKSGLFGVLSGGAMILRGPGGMLEDNNDFALALVMNIPLLFYLGRSENNALIRKGCDVVILLTMVAVLLTHSRGAFVAMTCMMLLMAWRSGKLVQAIAVLLLAAVGFFAFAPAHVVDRLATIGQGAKESSARARIISWTVALRMIEANPVFGVGLRNFQRHYLRHADGLLEGRGSGFAYVAHNSYLQIWAEGGTISFIVYLWLLSSVYFTTRWIRMRARYRLDLQWAYSYARMFEATTAGFAVGAVFLNRGHFDLIYHWLAMTTCLSFVFMREYAKQGQAVEPEAVDTGLRVRWKSTVSGPSLLPRW